MSEIIRRESFDFAADWITRLARSQKMFCRYRQLCRALRRKAIGEDCETRAARALRTLGVEGPFPKFMVEQVTEDLARPSVTALAGSSSSPAF